MSIDKLPSGKYRARVHIGGGKYRSRAFDRKGDAQTWEADLRRAVQTGTVDSSAARTQTLAELAAEHFTARSGDLDQTTLDTYRTLWRAHVHSQPLAVMTLAQVTPAAIDEWQTARLKAGAGRQAIRKTHALIQTVLDRAVRLGRIPSNPAKLVKKPSVKRGDRRAKPVSPAGVEKIRARLKDPDAVFVSVLAYAGMRPGEVRALTWGDIGTSVISVYGSKTDKGRSVRLMKPLADDLALWREQAGRPKDDVPVFARGGKPWTESDYRNWRRRTFTPAVKAAKVDLGRPYDLRHSAVSLWLHEGVSAIQVAAWLGHSPAMTLSTYAHVIADLPKRRTKAETVIRAARRDIPVT